MDSLTIKTPKIHKISFLPSECALCTIPDREPLIYEDPHIYLVSTKQMKGHKVRVMAVAKRHVEEPSFEERTLCYVKLYQYMSSQCETWYLVDDTYASVKGHFHLMACDARGTSDPMLYITPRVKFPLEPSS